MYELNALGNPVRTNKQYWHNGRFPHWDGFTWSFSYTFNNSTFKKWKESIDKRRGERTPASNSNNTGDSPPAGDEPNLEPITKDSEGMDKNAKLGGKKEAEVDDGYVKLEIPWSLTVSYSTGYSNSSTFNYDKMQYDMKWRHSLTFNGNIGLGKGWKVSANMTYNFDYMKVTACSFNISRDLHCWNMTASINPLGQFKSYTFHIGVNASMLSDLKYDKNSNSSTNSRINWW